MAPRQYTLDKLSSLQVSSTLSAESQNHPTWVETLVCKCFIPLCSRKINKCRISITMDSSDLALPRHRLHHHFCSLSTLTLKSSSLLWSWNSLCLHLCPCSLFLHGYTALNMRTPSTSFPSIRDFHTLLTHHCPSLSPRIPNPPSLSSIKHSPTLSVSWLSCIFLNKSSLIGN